MKPGLGAVCVTLLLALPAAAAEAPRPAEAGQTFEAPGATIYYEVRGSAAGTPLVLVNGGPGFDHTYLHSSAVWDQIARARRVVYYDQRGNGRSPLSAGQSCNLADQISDLDALRGHLGAERIDLLGHSWGGYLVMAYAARHPEHVAHLVIVDSAAPKWSETTSYFNDIFPEGSARQEAVAFASALGDRAADDTNIREYLSMLFYSPEKRDLFLTGASSYAYNKDVNQQLNTDLARYDLKPELLKLRMPTLVATGRFDINVTPSVAWKIHKAIAGSRFVVFEKSGHLPWFEEPDAFQKTLEAFLDGR